MATFNFNGGTSSKPKSPTVADAVSSGQFFQTGYGSIYVKGVDGRFVLLGNPKVSSHNRIESKSASYFDNRQSESVTLLGTTFPPLTK